MPARTARVHAKKFATLGLILFAFGLFITIWPRAAAYLHSPRKQGKLHKHHDVSFSFMPRTEGLHAVTWYCLPDPAGFGREELSVSG